MNQDNSTDYDDSSEEKIITNRIACVVAHCMEMYYEKYIHKECCMTSQYNGKK